jgi:hypothetical protein
MTKKNRQGPSQFELKQTRKAYKNQYDISLSYESKSTVGSIKASACVNPEMVIYTAANRYTIASDLRRRQANMQRLFKADDEDWSSI